MEMVLVWVETGHPNLIGSICAWSKNGPQNRGTAGDSLGAWGLTKGASYKERGREGAPESSHGLKPQAFSGVITMRISCVRSGPASIPRP